MAQSKQYNSEQTTLDLINDYFSHLKFTLQDLRNVTPEIVSRFYNAFFEELGVNTTNLMQIQMNQMTLISHVDMYNGTVPIINLYCGINFFLRQIGINDFVVSDLMNPTPKRTLCHFSNLMTFITYCDDKICSLTPELDKINEMKDARYQLRSKIELLRSEINKKATERVEKRQKILEYQKCLEKDKEKFTEICKEKEIQTLALERIKKIIEQGTEKEGQLIRVIKNIEEEIDGLKNMVVQSPEKLIADLEELNEKKDDCIEILNSLRSQIENKQKIIQTVELEHKEQEARFEKLKELMEMKKFIARKKAECHSLESKCNNLIEDIEERKRSIDNQILKRNATQINVEMLKEKKEKQDLEYSELTSRTEKELKKLKLQRKEIRNYKDQLQTQINEIHNEIKTIETKKLSFEEGLEKRTLKLKNMEENLMQKMKNVIEKLSSFRREVIYPEKQ